MRSLSLCAVVSDGQLCHRYQAVPRIGAGLAKRQGEGARKAGSARISSHVPKRRKSLLGTVVAQQATDETPDAEASAIDSQVQAEVERFKIISQTIVAAGEKHAYYQGMKRLNLRQFWADHKTSLPLHFAVYMAEVGCKKSAAANVESVFSGAGKFTDEAKSAGHVLISRIVRLHYQYNYTSTPFSAQHSSR